MAQEPYKYVTSITDNTIKLIIVNTWRQMLFVQSISFLPHDALLVRWWYGPMSVCLSVCLSVCHKSDFILPKRLSLSSHKWRRTIAY